MNQYTTEAIHQVILFFFKNNEDTNFSSNENVYYCKHLPILLIYIPHSLIFFHKTLFFLFYYNTADRFLKFKKGFISYFDIIKLIDFLSLMKDLFFILI